MNKIFIAISLFLVLSCKSDKKTDEVIEKPITQELPKVEVSQDYEILLNAEVLKDDVFLLNYLSEYEEGNQLIKENNIIAKVKGKVGTQSIGFKLPKDVDDIRRVRMNFGKNRELKNIKIQNITIQKGNKKWIMNMDDINRYFVPNNYLKINDSNSSFGFFEKNGSYNPFILSKWSLENAIVKSFEE